MYPYTQCPTRLLDLQITKYIKLLSKIANSQVQRMASLVHFRVLTGDRLATPRTHFCFKEER
jgi:hypothetical protein